MIGRLWQNSKLHRRRLLLLRSQLSRLDLQLNNQHKQHQLNNLLPDQQLSQRQLLLLKLDQLPRQQQLLPKKKTRT